MKRKWAKISTFFQSAMVIVIASLFAMSIVYAATTIGANITTDGTLNVTGLTTMGSTTSTSATSSVYLMVGSAFSTPTGFDFYEDLAVSDDLVVGGQATITGSLLIGGAFTWPAGFDFSNDLAVSGDFVLGGFASTTGDLRVDGGTIDLSTSSATTSPGIFSRSSGDTSTSTVSIGDVNANGSSTGCLEMVKEEAYYHCFLDAAETALVCQPGRCNPSD